MEKAKQAISGFVGRSGQHDTTVHEAVAPAVQHETVKPHQHEEINTAVDKEVHQDHYHRTVQPVQDREVLPEQHHAKLGEVQHREHDHRDHDHTKRALTQDQAQFKDERRVDATSTSRSVAPTVGGEHQHHHIHETIQPVVQKETIQPHVTHTTVPIHEVHHNKATHHDTTALPAMTMDQFKSKGGALSGREERYDEFQGVPKNIGGGGAGGFAGAQGLERSTHAHGQEHARHGDFADSGMHGNTTGSGLTGSHQHGERGVGGQGLTGAAAGAATGAGLAGAHHEHGERGLGGQGQGLSGSNTGAGLTGSHQQHGERGLGGQGQGLTGSNTGAGLTGSHHDHADRGLGGQGNLTGSSTQGGVTSTGTHGGNNLTSNRQDDLTSSGHHGTDGAIGSGTTGKMARTDEHLDSEHLPKALTEDRSKAVPHTPINNNKETAGHHDNSHTAGDQKKPGLMDKLNPKKDADGDGKAGFMS